ncbi:MAG: LuxR C-terminal-related transcriptional regulator [Spirochaetota bacterium]
MQVKKCVWMAVLVAVSVGGAAAAEEEQAGGAVAERGVLDLSAWPFREAGIAELVGEWEVFWGQQLYPEESRAAVHGGGTLGTGDSDGYFGMPSTWNDWEHQGEPVGRMGVATYAVEVLMPHDMERAAMWIPNASTAYSLWVNGDQVAQSGTVGASRETSIPLYRMNTVQFPVPEGRLEVVLQVSNFHHRRGGMWKAIKIGTPDQIRSLDGTETMYDLLLIGSFLAFGLYNIFLYASNRKQSVAPLLLATVFFAMSFRLFVVGQMLASRLAPGFPWWLQLRIEYLSAPIVFAMFAWLIDRIYPGWIHRYIIYAITAFVAVNLFIILAFPVLVYSLMVWVYNFTKSATLLAITAWFLVQAARGKREAWPMIGAIVVFLFITLGETLHYTEILLSRDFAPLVFLVRVFGLDLSNNNVLYLLSTVVTLAVIILCGNFLVLKISRSFLHVEERLTPLPVAQLAADYQITRREAEILDLVAQGLSNKEIGARLYISEGTVKNHLYRIMKKLNAGNRTELVVRLRTSGAEVAPAGARSPA